MRQLYKLVIIGDGGVGKTTTIYNIYQYFKKKFPTTTFKSCSDQRATPTELDRTKFIDFHTITFQFQDQKIVWQIWDVQGQRFPSSKAYTSLNPLDHITSVVIKNTDLILLTYDSSNNATFNQLFIEEGFYNLIKPFIAPDQKFLLLASKTDLITDNLKDPVNKIVVDMNFDEITFNNTYLQNISTLSETLFSSLNMENSGLCQPSSTGDAVSLKVYR